MNRFCDFYVEIYPDSLCITDNILGVAEYSDFRDRPRYFCIRQNEFLFCQNSFPRTPGLTNTIRVFLETTKRNTPNILLSLGDID